MHLELWHLDGGERGRVETVAGPRAAVGSDPGADVCLGGAPGVLPRHVEIAIEDGKAFLRPDGAVRLNGRLAAEAVLRDGDLLELGEEVCLRVRLVREPEERAREFAGALGRAPAGRRARPLRLRFGALGTGLTLLFAALVVGGAWFTARSDRRPPLGERLALERTRQDRLRERQQRAYEERIAGLKGELARLEERVAPRAEVDARVGEVKRAVAEVESTLLRRVSSRIEASIEERPELKEARETLRRLHEQDAAAERIITTYAPSVCLVQGAYGFGRKEKGTWRWLREASAELVKNLKLESDQVPLMFEGDGPVFLVEYTGTGFLVDREGILLTNRHIAQPWWHNEAAESLLAEGYEARFLYLRAYFPGRREPYEVEAAKSVISETTDLAALRFTPEGELPTPLELAPAAEVAPGRRVLLLGYPSGLDALIARTEEELARKLTGDGRLAPLEVLDALAARGLVRPLPTQGHISDVLPDKLLFDAPTAVGGSGGPLLDMEGRVVAVNYGILKAFSGANFGVPAPHARTLLARVREAK